MEKRLILTIIVSLLILVVYNHFFGPRRELPQAPVPVEEAPVPTVPAPLPEEAPEQKPELPAAAFAPLEPQLKEQLEAQKDLYLQEIEIDTELYRVVLTNKGGRIKSWNLKKYKHPDAKGAPLDLVSPASHAIDHYPLSLNFNDDRLTRQLNTGLYKVEYIGFLPDKRQEGVVFTYLDPSGLKVTKKLNFHHDNYYVDINIKWENLTDKPRPLKYYIDWGYGLGPPADSATTYNHIGPSVLIDGKLEKETPDDIEDKLEYKGNISWVALQNTYFAAMLIPKTVTSEVLITKREKEHVSVGLAAEAVELAPGDVVSQQFGLYAGPQELDKLEAMGAGLEQIVDYGWFSFLAKPVMQVLKFFHSYSGNYGIDIIILTIIIKILFWPLTNASFKSMKDMQKIQPKMTALRQKYKSDPQRLNTEIMGLYKKHKVNPVGGCMPMALQIPIFFALYKALLISIELRHAPFCLWITDLSAAEPGWFGLWQAPTVWLDMRSIPILMGITMYLQQKMTPAGDPKQAKMMMMMPVFMVFIFYNMPTGLVLYFLLNNILTLIQQNMINKK